MLRKAVRIWLHGLVSAAIGGVASGVVVAIVAPQTFNMSPEGLVAIGKVAAAMGLWTTATYLKQSPIWKLEE